MKSFHLTCETEIEEREKITVKITLNLDNWNFKTALIFRYLEANIENSVIELINQMIDDEPEAGTKVGRKREQVLRRIRNQAEKSVRARVVKSEDFILPLELRKQKRLLSEDFFLERGKFAKKFMSAYQKTIENDELPNRTNIAKYLFPENENRLQSLRRELEKYYEDFDEILFAITHRKEIQAAIDAE